MKEQTNIIRVSEDQRMSDDFIPPAKFFVVDALGDGVFFRTNSRAKAQTMSDELYGKGKYTVRVVVLAGVR